MVRIPRQRIKPKVYEELVHDLTFFNRAWYQAQKRGFNSDTIPQYFYGFREDEKYLHLPCFVDWDKYDFPAPKIETIHGQSITPIVPRVTYRPNQRDAARALDEQLAHRQSGILSLACGKGKTVLSVAAWAAMPHAECGLAITTTRKIADQWVERLLQFTDIDPSDIGYIGNNRCEWKDKKFVVAIINTLALREFPQEFYERFGVVYYDECHRLGAPFFSKVAGLFTGTRIGLSATWERSDGLEKLFMLHIGPIFHEDRSQTVIPDIYFAKTPIALDLSGHRMWKGRGKSGEVNHAKVITWLSRNSDRHDFIIRHVLDAHMRLRKVLVLGDRKEELLELQARLPDGLAGICVSSLDGRKMSDEAQEEALQKPIVLATRHLLSEGFDNPEIDTLFILYPQSNSAFAEQTSGRILRQMENKQPPVVVVMNDAGLFLDESQGAFSSRRTVRTYPFKRICERMEENFKRLGYTIKRGAA